MNAILCFGDSNTWGYDPVTKERYPSEMRWYTKVVTLTLINMIK